MEAAVIEHYKESLPNKPYYTDDFELGLRIAKKSNVLGKRYLQHNQPELAHWIVIDCDYKNAMEKLLDNPQLPVPNIVCISKTSGNSHIYYAVEPVKTVYTVGDMSTFYRCLNLLAKVEFSLKNLLNGDLAYVGLISKNPLSDNWWTYPLKQELYSLDELKEYIQLPKKLPRKALEQGFGRNVALFETTRHTAYQEVEKWRESRNLDGFIEYMRNYIDFMNKNTNFKNLLPQSEIKSLAKSIATWTYKNYKINYTYPDGRIVNWKEYVKESHSSERQSIRNRRRKNTKNAGRKSIGEPWVELGITRTAYFRKKTNKKY